jgi:autotransporter passenger strand-loop-strand repeat protein
MGGGVASGTMILAGGYEQAYVNGKTVSAVVMNGGREYALSGGTVSAAIISSGGGLNISSGGKAIGADALAGGGIAVLSGGVGSALVVSGGNLVVYSGGALTGGLTIEAGTATISGTAAAGQTISFTGPTGDLVLENLGGFAAKIAGMSGTGQKVDLLGFAYSSSTESAVWSQGTGSGTLTVTDGAQVASLTLIGSYVTSNFTLSNDGHGGTYVLDPPVVHTAVHTAAAKADLLASTDAGLDVSWAFDESDDLGGVANVAAQSTYVGGFGPEWNFAGESDYAGAGIDSFRIENIASAGVGAVVNGPAHYTPVTTLAPDWSFHG